MQDLEGKVAVVTGAASGIGRALADRFAAAGMKLALADVEDGPLKVAHDEFVARGVEAIALRTDVTDLAEVEALRDATVEAFGTAHVVCNNAGVAGPTGLTWETAPAAWRWVVDVNLWGVVNGVQAFLPLLVDQREGHVVNTASMAGLVAPPFMSAYVATKHAVVGMSESIFHELRMAKTGVGISVLCPGWVRTRIHESHRNWLDRYGDIEVDGGKGLDGMAQATGGLIESGKDPAEIADAVHDAIVDDRFWVLTHLDMAQATPIRWDRALAGKNPVFGGLEP